MAFGEEVVFPEPLGLGCISTCVCTREYIQALMEVNKLQMSVLWGHAQIVSAWGKSVLSRQF